jgi:ribose 5-phosphate isomerase B
MTKTHIIIAADHGGFDLKTHLVGFLKQEGFEVTDLGTANADAVDYPDFAQKAAKAILDGKASWGIIICGTGIGISIAANRIKGIRCALCTSPEMGRLARQHNNANLLALGGRTTTPADAEAIVKAFAEAEFEGGRHQNRVNKIDMGCA